MPSIILGAEQADVLQGGQIVFTQLFETYAGSGQGAIATGVTISVTSDPSNPGAGSGTPVPQTAAGVTSVNLSTWSYTWNVPASTVTGDYLVTWTGTVLGTTTLTYRQAVTVAGIPQGLPAPGCYATFSQYQAWSGDYATPQTVVSPKIMRASEDIDRALMGAVYPVNSAGMPTDALVIDVIMRATCAQVQWLIAENDDAGTRRQYSQVSTGGVNATRISAATGTEMPPLGPRALSILHVNGVLPSAVLVNW